MSKYQQLRNIMGGQEEFNDKTVNGRVLKWYSPHSGMAKADRDAEAAKILESLKGVPYVQKVQIRNAWMYGRGMKMMDYDKICVHITPI